MQGESVLFYFILFYFLYYRCIFVFVQSIRVTSVTPLCAEVRNLVFSVIIYLFILLKCFILFYSILFHFCLFRFEPLTFDTSLLHSSVADIGFKVQGPRSGSKI
jgi:hypothetical protein